MMLEKDEHNYTVTLECDQGTTFEDALDIASVALSSLVEGPGRFNPDRSRVAGNPLR
jgi:hypothetical protein